ILIRRGVEIKLNTRLHGATVDAALLAGGERIPARTVVSTVPSAPNPLVAALPCKKEKGRIVVDQHLEVPDYPGVWAVGDCAWILDARTGEPCPPTAQHAIREAKCLAANIAATIRGTVRKPFAFNALGKMGSLGHRSAVAEVFGLKISGFLAWWLWRTVYLMKLPGLDRKLRVATDWTLDLLLPPDIVQLKTDKSFSIRREHFEPDEVIFREGDRGDDQRSARGACDACPRLRQGRRCRRPRLRPRRRRVRPRPRGARARWAQGPWRAHVRGDGAPRPRARHRPRRPRGGHRAHGRRGRRGRRQAESHQGPRRRAGARADRRCGLRAAGDPDHLRQAGRGSRRSGPAPGRW